jgi:uncharacterized membrane protein YdjX (TVP38/TMEM64 family)
MLWKRILLLMGLLLLMVGLGLAGRQWPGLEWLITHEQGLRAYVAHFPIRSWLLGLVLYVVLSLVPGTAGKSIVCGWIYGFLPAVVMVDLGLTIAAVLSFLLGRYLMGGFLQSHWSGRLQTLSRWFEREGAIVLITVRLLHAPFTIVNYGSGATSIPLRTFWWTTHLGILPGTIVFTLAGTQLPSLREIAHEGVESLFDWRLLLSLTLVGLLPVALRWLVPPRSASLASACADEQS